MSVDPFAHDDAAYVLGSLRPTQRRAFEEHLETCEACARSVRDIAGLPGLLAGLPAEAYAEPGDLPPVPDTMLPTLLSRVRRTRQRNRWLTLAGAAAAAVVLVVALAAALTGALGGDEPGTTPVVAPPAQTMQQVRQDQLTATVSLQQVAWGTKMHLACRYAGTWVQPGASYALRVHTKDGQTQQVATWKALPDKTMQLDAATSVDPVDIDTLDVVLTGSDRPLLTLSPTVVS